LTRSRALRLAGCTASDAIAVGDASRDVLTANGNGVAVVAVAFEGERPRKADDADPSSSRCPSWCARSNDSAATASHALTTLAAAAKRARSTGPRAPSARPHAGF
jgi:hypothetical protein